VKVGLSPREVGTRFGLSPSTVSDVLQRAGVSRRQRTSGPPEHLRERNDQIVHAYVKEGLTLKEVGRRFDLSAERVRQILRGAGAKARPRGADAKVRGERLKGRNLEIVRLYVEERLTLAKIGARVGLSPGRTSQVVGTAGVSRRRPGVAGRKKGTPLGSAEERRKRNDEIVRLYTEGRLPAKEVAARFGLTECGVLYILNAAGVRRRSKAWRAVWPWRDANERSKQITAAYAKEGLCLREIAVHFGLSPSTVSRILDEAGVPRRRASGRSASGLWRP